MLPQPSFTPRLVTLGPGTVKVTAKAFNVGFPLLGFMVGFAGLAGGVMVMRAWPSCALLIDGDMSVKLLSWS